MESRREATPILILNQGLRFRASELRKSFSTKRQPQWRSLTAIFIAIFLLASDLSAANTPLPIPCQQGSMAARISHFSCHAVKSCSFTSAD
jgi:hypothetical protein